jgi:hypothetical protein
MPIVTYVVRSITDYTSPLVKIEHSNFILYSYRTWTAVHNKHWKKQRWIFCFICMFCRSLLFFCTFSFGHCVVCSSSIYGFWLPFWYLQTLLVPNVSSILVFSIIDYTRTTPTPGGEPMCSIMVSSSCLLSDTRHVSM